MTFTAADRATGCFKGIATGDAIAQWSRALARRYRPDTLVIGIGAGATGLLPVLDKAPATEGVNAWVCQGSSCLPAIGNLAELERTLSASPHPA